MDNILEAKNLGKNFLVENNNECILKEINIQIKASQWMSLLGPSGSGKSTLLNILSGLMMPSSGQVFYESQILNSLSDDKKSEIRSSDFGFVFQFFELVEHLTAFENIRFMLELNSLVDQDSDDKVKALLESVGLGHRKNHFPRQLSGGEKQRVALARAFIHDPILIFADEPTGNLDEKNSEKILELLKSLSQNNKTTIVSVSHDRNFIQYSNQAYEFKGYCLEQIK